MDDRLLKSEEQAEIIKLINLQTCLLDLEFCKQAANDMIRDADQQDSMAVLSRFYMPEKADLLREKGAVLLKLVEFCEGNKKLQQMAIDIKAKEAAQAQIDSFFMR